MKRITLLIVFLVSAAGFSQANKQKIQTYFENNLAKLEVSHQDVSDWIIQSEASSKTTKITNYRVVQRYQGIELFDSQSNVWVKDGEVINVGNRFKRNISQMVNTTTPQLTVLQAVANAYNKVGSAGATSFSIVENKDNKNFIVSDGVQEDPIIAKLAFLPTSENQLKLAWGFQFYSLDGKHYWDVKIDAVNGTLLDKKDLTISCHVKSGSHAGHSHDNGFSFESNVFNTASSMLATPGTYRVIPYNYVSPNHSPFQLITTVGDPLASPNGWHDASNIGESTPTLQYTYTRGNNILAQEDADGNNGTGIRPDGGASLNFDYTYGGQTAIPTSYTPSSTTNLFYFTNVMHDVWYRYGFDEANANFQQNNLGRGGQVSGTGDAVYADSQDGYAQTTPTLDNANFTPTNDGARPRIQMFLWTLGAPPTNYITVNSPESIAGPRAATQNVFEGTDSIPVPVAPNGITSDLVLYTNEPVAVGSSPNSGCAPATNAFDLTGKIALIKRGNCFFNLKVKNAQDAGAAAVIVMDSVANNPVRLSMSSTGILGITIPAVFITKEIGDELIAEMANGAVNVKLEVPANLYLYADGSFDNGIVAHEYGHGISNRLIGGGAAGCMTNLEQMGEGWSDWFSLMMQIKVGDNGNDPKPIGTYAINQPNDGDGIRTLLGSADSPDYSYSTNMDVNPLTLANSNYPFAADNNYKYELGDVWASMMWDLTWKYIEKYGFDPDLYTGNGGNNKVMQLALDALKLETCNQSSFISARNNLFAAEQATTGGEDYCMIAEVFRRRGLGLNASSGDVNNNNDQVEDFTPFPAGANCVLAVNHFAADSDLFRVYPNPSNGTFNVRINQFTGKVNLQVVDINGRIVYNVNDQDFNVEKTVNLNHLQKGMYVLKVSNADLNYTEKIIIK